MVGTAHWLTGGGTVGWPTSSASTNVDIGLPANALVRRFQLRHVNVYGSSHGTGFQYAQPLAMSQTVSFTTGKYAGRTIYHATKDCPFEFIIFVPITGDNCFAIYHGGDNEFGFNQRCDYGGAGSAASNLRFSWFISSVGTPNVYNVGMNYEFAVLAYY